VRIKNHGVDFNRWEERSGVRCVYHISFFFLFKSCIRLFSAEPDRAKLTRDKELACIGEIWRKQTLCETPSYRPKERNTNTPSLSGLRPTARQPPRKKRKSTNYM